MGTPDLAAIARHAIEKAGGGAALGRHLRLRRSAIQAWKTARIPAEHVPAVSRLTGMSLAELRPDIHGHNPSSSGDMVAPEGVAGVVVGGCR